MEENRTDYERPRAKHLEEKDVSDQVPLNVSLKGVPFLHLVVPWAAVHSSSLCALCRVGVWLLEAVQLLLFFSFPHSTGPMEAPVCMLPPLGAQGTWHVSTATRLLLETLLLWTFLSC